MSDQFDNVTRGTGRIVLKGGKALDPSCGIDGDKDILIEDGSISAIDKPGSFAKLSDVETVDVAGKLIVPGLVDIHVHFREPGFEWRETVETGSRAAVAGGFTTVCCMPNTNPCTDNAQVVEFIFDQARAADLCRVYPIGAITEGRHGKALAALRELADAGCVAFSDDGAPVSNSAIMRRALEYCLMLDTVLTVHEEDLELSNDFVMNESALSLKMGLRGMPGAAEDIMIARDIELAALTGGRVHFCHVTTARGVTLIRRAKEDGINVTAETAAHYFTLDESAVIGYETSAKMSMPLRSKKDSEAILEGLASGVIDCIASDHAPHEYDSKEIEFDKASFGILGLQTTLPLTLAKVRAGKLTLARAIESLTTAPARCLGLPLSQLKVGKHADLAVIDLERSYTLTKQMIRSKSKNTPFLGHELKGVAVKTFVAGRQVFDISELEGLK